MKTIQLKYDGDGSLKYKRVIDAATSEETIRYYIVDHNNHTGYSQIVEELNENGDVVGVNTFGLDLISSSAFVQNETSGESEWQDRIYIYDGSGSVRILLDLEGNITNTFAYDSFGNLLNQQSSTSTKGFNSSYLYRGERYDQDLDQYYLRARYYTPDTGRFHSMDTYEGNLLDPLSLHKYLYAHANPVNGFDPSGNMTLTQVMVGSTVSVGLGVALYMSTPTGLDSMRRATDVLLEAGVAVTGEASDMMRFYLMMQIANSLPQEKANAKKKQKTSECTAIIGETWERVLFATAVFADENPEIFEPLAFGGEDIILQQGPSQTPFRTVAHFNVAWIRSVMARGCHIIDIGIDLGRVVPGPYYEIEVEETAFYFSKRFEVIPPSTHLYRKNP